MEDGNDLDWILPTLARGGQDRRKPRDGAVGQDALVGEQDVVRGEGTRDLPVVIGGVEGVAINSRRAGDRVLHCAGDTCMLGCHLGWRQERDRLWIFRCGLGPRGKSSQSKKDSRQ